MNSYLKKIFFTILTVCGLESACFAASPFVTVPWNGYSGAASFTFDDGLCQVEFLPQIFQELPEVKVTFFLSNMGLDLVDTYGFLFAELAKMDHEIGNHTNNHPHLPNLPEYSIRSEVIDFANDLEQVMSSYGADVNITSHALPYSANNDIVSSIINERHFINRSAGGTGRHNWDEEPRWTNMDSRAWYTFPNADEELLKAIDTAAYIGDYTSDNPWYTPVKGPSWLVLLNHGISYLGEGYITPELMKEAFQRAVKNNMWVAPFSTVGAYYRSHFTLDTASAVADGENFTVTWKLPHKNMPKSIPLKVILNEDFIKENFGKDACVLIEQNGRIIYPDENGVFLLEFTALNATIYKVSDTPYMKPYKALSIKGMENTPASSKTTYTLLDTKGRRLANLTEPKVPDHMSKGTYIILSQTSGAAPQARKIAH